MDDIRNILAMLNFLESTVKGYAEGEKTDSSIEETKELKEKLAVALEKIKDLEQKVMEREGRMKQLTSPLCEERMQREKDMAVSNVNEQDRGVADEKGEASGINVQENKKPGDCDKDGDNADNLELMLTEEEKREIEELEKNTGVSMKGKVEFDIENAPRPLSRTETIDEVAERMKKKTQILVLGGKWRYRNNIEALAKILEDEAREKLNVKLVEFRRSREVIISVGDFEKKKALMRKRKRLSYLGIEVANNMTQRKKEVQEWLDKEAGRLRMKGLNAWSGHLKIFIDGMPHVWEEFTGGMEEI